MQFVRAPACTCFQCTVHLLAALRFKALQSSPWNEVPESRQRLYNLDVSFGAHCPQGWAVLEARYLPRQDTAQHFRTQDTHLQASSRKGFSPNSAALVPDLA